MVRVAAVEFESALETLARDFDAKAFVDHSSEFQELKVRLKGRGLTDRQAQNLSERLVRAFFTNVSEDIATPFQDTLARLSGDEFAILMQTVDGPSQVEDVLRRVLGPLEVPFVIDGRELRVSASAGYSLSFGVTDAKELLKQADDSMYQAKYEGKNRVHQYVDPVDHLIGFA